MPRFEKRGATVVAVSGESLELGRGLAERLSLTIPLVSDPRREWIAAYGLADPANETAWPAVYVVARDGTVVWRWLAPTYPERPAVEAILAALPSS